MFGYRRRQSGQSIVVIALFATILFIFVGLGIDSGMLYIERRHLQNVADASCLAAATELTLDGARTVSDAVTAAQHYFALNMNGSARAAFQLPDPVPEAYLPAKPGEGASLTHGIDVGTEDIRVAITVPASTYFLRLAGMPGYNVMARSRCLQKQGGGILPIAVVRFPGYDQTGNSRIGVANTGVTLPQFYGNGKKQKKLVVRDVLQAASNTGGGLTNSGVINDGSAIDTAYAPAYDDCTSIKRNWYDWSTIDVATSKGPFHNVTAACAAGTGSSPTPNAAGYEVWMAGQGAIPNVGNPSFSGFINLDVRSISTTPHQYYNGKSSTTSANDWKNTIEEYVRTQYPGPEVTPGEQIGVLSGVNAGTLIDAVQDRYKVGDTVTTLVYDGQVYRNADFVMSITCDQTSDANCDNSAGSPGRTVSRPQENGSDPVTNAKPAPNFSSNCDSYDGSFYIADASQLSGVTLPASPAVKPATYLLKMAPIATNKPTAGVPITLLTRLSGPNLGSGGDPAGIGSPEEFGSLRVRWSYVSGDVSIPAGSALKDSGGNAISGWRNPNASPPPVVTMPANTSVVVKLEVIQTSTKTVKCKKGSTLLDIVVPDRASGAYTLQVTGRSNLAAIHSVFGWLGMESKTSGNPYDSGDFFVGFETEPTDSAQNQSPHNDISANFALIDANTIGGTDTELRGSDIGTPLPSTRWYTNTTYLSTPPATATITLPAGSKPPVLNISVPDGAAPGEYRVDTQLTSTGGKTHSVRFFFNIENANSPSIDEYVVALCYADFKFTDFKPNYIAGRAVSGCKKEEDVTKGLLSRLIAWN